MFIRSLLFLIFIGAANGLMAQSTQKITYDFQDFNALRITDDFEVYFTQTDGEESIELEVSDNLVNKLEVYQKGKTLYLGTKGVRNWYNTNKLILHIQTANTIEDISIASDAKLYLETPLEVDRLAIRVSSDAELRGIVNAKILDFQASSDGNAKLSGKVEKLKAHLASDAYLKGFDLEVDHLDIHLSSDSWAEITVNDKLKAVAYSDAVLKYRGNPTNSNKRTYGDATIKKVN